MEALPGRGSEVSCHRRPRSLPRPSTSIIMNPLYPRREPVENIGGGRHNSPDAVPKGFGARLRLAGGIGTEPWS